MAINEKISYSRGNDRAYAEAVWLALTPEERAQFEAAGLPLPSEGDVKEWGNGVLQIPALYNTFFGVLINRIGRTYVNRFIAHNPLEFLRGENLVYGNMIQDIYVDMIESFEKFDPNKECNLCSAEKPPVEVLYYVKDFDDKYKVMVNRYTARTAFNRPGTMDDIFNAAIDQLYQAERHNYFRYIKFLLGNFTGYTNVSVPAIVSDDNGATAKANLLAMRTYVRKIRFDSRAYNNIGVMNNTRPEDIVIFATPETLSLIDVEYLAGVFNLNRVEVENRIVEIDDFGGLENTSFLIIDRRAIQVHYMDYFTDFFHNPDNQNDIYWLFSRGIIAMSKFHNALRFTSATIRTVSYNANGGTGAMPNMYIDNGKTFVAPKNTFTAPNNKIFAGWATTSGATTAQYQPGDTVTASADMTLYALWGNVVVS